MTLQHFRWIGFFVRRYMLDESVLKYTRYSKKALIKSLNLHCFCKPFHRHDKYGSTPPHPICLLSSISSPRRSAWSWFSCSESHQLWCYDIFCHNDNRIFTRKLENLSAHVKDENIYNQLTRWWTTDEHSCSDSPALNNSKTASSTRRKWIEGLESEIPLRD